MPPRLFLRRFLEHVLPHGFVRIRHYGLLASSNVETETRLARARELLGADVQSDTIAQTPEEEHAVTSEQSLVELVRQLAGIDLRRCPRCHAMSMQLAAAPLPRGPPP